MERLVVTHSENLQRLNGIVERVTFHNPENGWTVLKVSSFKDPSKLVTVLIHQAKVFAGSTMEFWGTTGFHPKHGEQFKAVKAIEKKPASAAALEKYLGSGLIRGVGPVTAKKIVAHFREKTLEVFESDIEQLMNVPGIADKKLEQIKLSWSEHRSIRDVMLFLQGYGISTLFATKIFKSYGDDAIKVVSENPYRLAHDIYGIGFFSADKIALAMGFERAGERRIEAGIKHVLAASRDEGHCFLNETQILDQALELLGEEISTERLRGVVQNLVVSGQIMLRKLEGHGDCYYSKTLYFDEMTVAKRIIELSHGQKTVESDRIASWIERYCRQESIQLSDEQAFAVSEVPRYSVSVLTGGPGCGKTTCTRVLVQLLRAMKKRIVLAAPTGRAAQRMTEVIGIEAKTIHRILEWNPGKNGFKRDEKDPIQADFLIVDEASMLDISLAASLLKAVPGACQVLLIGDPDQLPAVGAGNVLADMLASSRVTRFRLTKVFRQAQESSIIRFAHEINAGVIPRIESPLANAAAFENGIDCLFVDADEATREQIRFLLKAKVAIERIVNHDEDHLLKIGDALVGRAQKSSEGIEVDSLYRPPEVSDESVRAPVLAIPERLKHVDLVKLAAADSEQKELLAVLKSVHPWSSLHFGMNAVETVTHLHQKTIPRWIGKGAEVQVLTPQVRGTLGAINLNEVLQGASNPRVAGKKEINLGSRIFRDGDRVIQTRNNYDLNVFNGDIGRIVFVDTEDSSCEVEFSGGAETRRIRYRRDDLAELSLAYAITIHKSQGSEFQVVIIPIVAQHFNMLFRNLIYTGLTRAKKLAIFVGSRKAFSLAVRQIDNRKRQTALASLLDSQRRNF